YGCSLRSFWGTIADSPAARFESDIQALPSGFTSTKAFQGFWGVIVRSNFCYSCTADKQVTGFYKRIDFAQISDGASNTMVVGEKRLRPSEYSTDPPPWHDDWGWKEGWDPDTLRSTICLFGPDAEISMGESFGYNFGSAHPGGMNAGFADGSVHSISFD